MKRIVRVEVVVEIFEPEFCSEKCPHLRRGVFVDASCTLFDERLKNRTLPMSRRDVVHTWERVERCRTGEVT